jgi:cell division protein FtsN
MKAWFFILFICIFSQWTWAQPATEQFRRAETLRQAYLFEEAATIFATIAAQTTDTVERLLAGRQLMLCENGQVLLRYIETPVVTGKATVPKYNFFNYYTVDAGGKWAITPPALHISTSQDDRLSPVFIPEPLSDVLYFAAQQAGKWDIFVIRRTDENNWTAPEPLDSNINTPFDERFPYVSPDGQTLYFSSNGHSGMGGYDLYKSTFDRVAQQWNTPENLGFPYSSPYDDWLFVPNTEQTEALFVSSREQIADSLTLYRIALEANPVKRPGYSVQEIQQIAKLTPPETKTATAAVPSTPDDTIEETYNALYQTLVQQQADMRGQQSKLDELRKNYGELTDADRRAEAQQTIMGHEMQLVQMQAGIRQTTEALRYAEQQLLAKGITPEIRTQATTTETAALPPFTPHYKPSAAFPGIVILPPEKEEPPAEDYSFRIEKTSVIYTEMPVAEGVTYRIQIGIFLRRLTNAGLKGISPVFVQTDKKKYTYYIGQFTTHGEANKALAEVKKKGFRDATLMAWVDGKKVTLPAAREYEKKPPTPPLSAPVAEPVIFNIVLGEFADGLPNALQQAVKNITNRDIVKKTSKGHVIYIVGPFSSAEDAQQIQAQLQMQGFETRIED